MNYISWGSTSKTELKQKHASRLIKTNLHIQNRYLMKKFNSLNIYQLNITKCWYLCIKSRITVSLGLFRQNQTFSINKYKTRSTKIQFLKPFFRITSTQFSISYRGPHLWNTLIPPCLHNVSFNRFKLEVKKKNVLILTMKTLFFK